MSADGALQQTLSGAAEDKFGAAVAVEGDVLAVGAYGYDGFAGAVYVYRLSGGTWSFQTRLTLPAAEDGDHFGEAVALSGGRLIAGAPGRTVDVTDSGAAYIYAPNTLNTWSQLAELGADDAVAGDLFGDGVDMDGEWVVIGASGKDGEQGGAYVFRESAGGGSWTQFTPLTAVDGVEDDWFGGSVAVDGDRILVGAPERNGGLGGVYPFRYGGGTWSPEPVLNGSGGMFGSSVALDGQVAAVGSPFADVPSTDAGAVNVYLDLANGWTHQDTYTPAIPAESDELGAAVAVGGQIAVAGSPGDAPVNAVDRGAAYRYGLEGLFPQLVSRTPAAGAVAVPTDTALTLTFNRTMSANGGTITLQETGGATVATFSAGDGVYNGETVTFALGTWLQTDTSYTLTIEAGTFVDDNGSVYPSGGAEAWNFATRSVYDVNLDGSVTTADVQTALGLLGDASGGLTDVNRDGATTPADVIAIINRLD